MRHGAAARALASWFDYVDWILRAKWLIGKVLGRLENGYGIAAWNTWMAVVYRAREKEHAELMNRDALASLAEQKSRRRAALIETIRGSVLRLFLSPGYTHTRAPF